MSELPTLRLGVLTAKLPLSAEAAPAHDPELASAKVAPAHDPLEQVADITSRVEFASAGTANDPPGLNETPEIVVPVIAIATSALIETPFCVAVSEQ